VDKPTPLLAVVQETIRKDGPLTVERYMEIVLHDPVHGYYRQGIPVGLEGDFSTGPEVSQMFGEMLAVWCVEMWHRMGRPNPFLLVELGPGLGSLMKCLLSGTEEVPAFQEALRLYLVESNATLRELQQERLAAYRPVHVDDLTKLPNLPILLVGNEFFDTFPMRQFVKAKNGWCERMVGLKGNHLVFVDGPKVEKPSGCDAHMKQAKGWFYETSPLSLSYVKQIATHIARHGGAGLLIDYGYEAPTGEDTLFALRRHKHTDVLSAPGRTDVTGDVDFGAFGRVAREADVLTCGPIGQGPFLRSLGIDWRAELLRRNSPEHIDKINDELFRLIDPSVMGLWFKVLGLRDNALDHMAGFS